MELVQQNIHMDRIGKEGSVQITLEDDVNLPEMKPDISSLCMEKGNVVVEEVRPGTDAVMVRGRLVFDILYHTQEDGGRLDCLDGKLLFEEKIRLDGLTAGDNVTVCGKIDDISVAVINSRKLSVQSVVTLSATVEEIYDETLPVGVSGEEGEDPQYRLVPMEFTQVCLCRKDVMRVKEELGLPQNYPKKEKQELVEEYIGLVGLKGFEKALPGQLSGGMQKRVAIARTLINKPHILLLDEPFGALDAFTRINLQKEVLRIWKKERMTVILVTHDIDEAIYMGNRVVVMSPKPGIVKNIYNIELPMPKSRTDEDFGKLRSHIYNEFLQREKTPEDYMI